MSSYVNVSVVKLALRQGEGSLSLEGGLPPCESLRATYPKMQTLRLPRESQTSEWALQKPLLPTSSRLRRHLEKPRNLAAEIIKE